MFPLIYAYRDGTIQELRPHVEMLRAWRSRWDRDIAPELMRLLQHERFDARYEAALLLGYLEHAPAEEPLHALLEQPSEADGAELDQRQRRLRLRFALARIHARDLKGEAKVESLAAAIGLGIDSLAPSRSYISFGHTSPEQAIRHDLFELLYSMVRKGEDIAPLRSRLYLGAYGVLLKSASLPLDEEVTRVLDHLEKQEMGGSGYVPTFYLANSGPRAHDLLLKRLQDMLEHPEHHFKSLPVTSRDIQHAEEAEKWAAEHGFQRDFSHLRRPHYAVGYSNLFHGASWSDDARFLPVLKQLEERFATDPDQRVRADAGSAHRHLHFRLRFLQRLDEDSASPPQ